MGRVGLPVGRLKGWLSQILCWVAAVAAVAQPGWAEVQPLSYFKSCEGFLTAAHAGQIERFFIEQVTSNEEALTLLYDYGIIGTLEIHVALSQALKKRGFELLSMETLTSDPLGPAWRNTMEKLRTDLLGWNDEQWRELVRDVFVELQEVIVSMRPPGGQSAQAANARGVVAQWTANFAREITNGNTPSRDRVVNAMAYVLKSEISNTILFYFQNVAKLRAERGQRPFATTFFRFLVGLGLVGGGAYVGQDVAYWSYAYLVDFDPYTYSNRFSQGYVSPWHLLVHSAGTVGGFLAPFSIAKLVRTKPWRTSAEKDRSQEIQAWIRRQWQQVENSSAPMQQFLGLLVPRKKSMVDRPIALTRLCSEDGCLEKKLSPVQLAHLADIEVVGLAMAKEQIVARLDTRLDSSDSNTDNHDSLLEAARSLARQPGEISKQLVFRARLASAIQSAIQFREGALSLGAQVSEYISQLNDGLARAQTAAYDVTEENEVDFRRRELLLLRIQAHRENLRDLNFNRSEYEAWVRGVVPRLVQIQDRVRHGQPMNLDWRAHAEAVLALFADSNLHLDEMQ